MRHMSSARRCIQTNDAPTTARDHHHPTSLTASPRLATPRHARSSSSRKPRPPKTRPRRSAHQRFEMPPRPPSPTRRLATPLIVSRLRQTSTTASSYPIGIASARQLSQTTAEPSSPKSDTISTVSTWFWRGVYVAAGAATAGAVATYATDPMGTREYVSNLRADVDSRIRFFTEPSREKLLPDPAVPYPGAPSLRTLVIDLDKTLVYSSYSRQTGWRVAKRPGAEAFLAYMASFYEIVVFTSAMNAYADPILDKMDPAGYIAHRLYRGETHYQRGVHIKDLSHLNRELSRVVLIDCDEKHFALQPENAILVPEWSGDPSDTVLLDLIPFLEALIKDDVRDVREELAMLKGKKITQGVAEYKALTASRAEQNLAAARGGSLFGNVAADGGAPPEAAPPADATEQDGARGAVWGSLSTTSKLFHRSGDQQSQGGE